ncbi:MAG: TRAP transporter small permease [Verrucomicrobiota bacterium]|jgi:TRAP-type C4-dicarboxylate transport system permease small subunit
MNGRLQQPLARGIGGLCIVVFFALILDVLWGVATRYLFGRQAPWSEELARLLLVWLAMLGAALAYIEQSHLGVDALTRLLDPAARRWAHRVAHFAVFAFAAGVMLYGGAALFVDRWQSGQVMSAIPLKKAWFYLSLPVSGLVIAATAFVSMLRGRIDSGETISNRDETPK